MSVPLQTAAVWIGVLTLATVSATKLIAATGGPSDPVNLTVTNVTGTGAELIWGPTEPGPFTPISSTNSTVTVKWGASTDTRGPITYQVWRDGTSVVTGYTGTSRTFSATRKVRSFRVCVQAKAGTLLSKQNCGTITRTG